MDKQYNWYNLEPEFKKYLLAGKNIRPYWRNSKKISGHSHPAHSPVTIKNYLSDLRHFLGWCVLKLKTKRSKLPIESLSPGDFVSLIDSSLIKDYKQYLVSNKIPLKTVNRRLSTLRKFFTFCIDQGWMRENLAKKVKNETKKRKKELTEKQILKDFENDLIKEKLDQKTIASYLEAVREFLSI